MALKGLEIDADGLRIWDDARQVVTTSGTLVLILPTQRSFLSQVLTFADGVKDYCYAWRGRDDRGFNPDPNIPDSHNQNNNAQIFFTRVPGDSESSVNLMTAPPGANFFKGLVKLTRTTSPTHTWYERTLATLPPTGQWIPWNGSGQIEASVGLTRIMHLVIEGGILKLIAEQSIGAATGGQNRNWGDMPASAIFSTAGDNEGGSFASKSGGTPGIFVWTSTSSPYRKNSNRVIETDGNPADFITHQQGNSDPVTTTDPTNYTSVYSVDVVGYFGKRG